MKRDVHTDTLANITECQFMLSVILDEIIHHSPSPFLIGVIFSRVLIWSTDKFLIYAAARFQGIDKTPLRDEKEKESETERERKREGEEKEEKEGETSYL